MRRLSDEEVKIKSPTGEILAAWTGHLTNIGQAHPNSIHTLMLSNESKGFNHVIFCWGKFTGNKISNYLIFKGRYNFWIPGKSSRNMAISTMERISRASMKVDNTYVGRFFPIRKHMTLDQITELDIFWDKAIESCWRSVCKKSYFV